MPAPLLRAAGVSKSFGAVHAVREVDIEIFASEIHAICGENGAGKSTLMWMLAGSLVPDAGALEFEGRPFAPAGPLKAARAGVAIVYQERSLLPNLSAAENICLATPAMGDGWLVDRGRMRARAQEILASLDPHLDPEAPVATLSTARQQVVEIAKALARNPKVLILDEPTSSIGAEPAARLFAILRRLREEGLAVVYISHHLDEVFRIADRVTVLRDGRGRGTRGIGELDEQSLVSLMVGREYTHDALRDDRRAGGSPVRLEVSGLGRDGDFEDIGLEVAGGEIVALTGLVGAGRSELGEAIFGVRVPDRGDVKLDGKPLARGRPDRSVALGLALLTEDRKEGGLFLDRSIRDNVAAPNLRSLGRLVDGHRAREMAERYMEELGIRAPSPDTPVSSLSGGNQQKVLLAMWLAAQPKVLIVDEPTRGVDVGAKDDIHRILDALVKDGLAVLLISSDGAEVDRLADRILVMRRGRLVAELPGGSDEEEIVAYASGARS